MKEKTANRRTETKNRFYYKKDRLNQLRGFCTTVQCGCSATKAGEVLNLQPGTIGQQIQTLESALNIDLFDKNYTNRLVITEEGQKFYESAVLALQHIDGVFHNYRKDLEDDRKNSLKIASVDAILGKIIKYAVEFKEKNPNVNITLLNITREEALEGLKKDEIDLVLYPSEVDEIIPVELERKTIARYNSYWILYKGHPLLSKGRNEISKEDIAKYPFGYLPNPYTSRFKRFLEDYKIISPIDLKNGTIEFLKEMIRGKMCITVLDDFYISPKDKKEFVLVNSSNAFPELFHYAYYKKNFQIKDLAKSFFEIIQLNKNKIFV